MMMLTSQFFKGLQKKIKTLNNTHKEFSGERIIKDWYQIVVHLRSGDEVQYYLLGLEQTDSQAVCLVTHDQETDTSRIVFIPYEEIALVETRITRFVGEAGAEPPRSFGFRVDQ